MPVVSAHFRSVWQDGVVAGRVGVVRPDADALRRRIRRFRRSDELLSHSSRQAHVPGNSRRHSVECFSRGRHSASYLRAVLRLVTAARLETARRRAACA